jgi:molecular chaperone GrpE
MEEDSGQSKEDTELRQEQKPPMKNNNGKSEKQVDILLVALAEEKKRSNDYLNRLAYLQADFDNYRKRADRNLDEAKKNSNERLVINLLEVVDELELAVKNGKTNGNSESIVQGVEMTLKKMSKLLEGEGVTPIDCLGKPFNPELHMVACTSSREEVADGTILEELRKGYMMNSRVIRPSMVMISVKSQEPVNDVKSMEEHTDEQSSTR